MFAKTEGSTERKKPARTMLLPRASAGQKRDNSPERARSLRRFAGLAQWQSSPPVKGRSRVRSHASGTNGEIAQSGERLPCKQIVAGSIPACSTSFIAGRNASAFAGCIRRISPCNSEARNQFGAVAEWFMAAVLKTEVPQGTVGSNPTCSAKSAAQSASPKWKAGVIARKQEMRTLLRWRWLPLRQR